jgi:AmiR/NasT family two-component response regulator
MERTAATEEEVLRVLRRDAFDAQRTVRQHAEEVVRSTGRGDAPAPDDD